MPLTKAGESAIRRVAQAADNACVLLTEFRNVLGPSQFTALDKNVYQLAVTLYDMTREEFALTAFEYMDNEDSSDNAYSKFHDALYYKNTKLANKIQKVAFAAHGAMMGVSYALEKVVEGQVADDVEVALQTIKTMTLKELCINIVDFCDSKYQLPLSKLIMNVFPDGL